MLQNSSSPLRKTTMLPGRIDYLSSHQRKFLVGWIVIISIITTILLFINLSYAPRIWYDEGSHLHVPKTLIQDGVYADKSAEGYRFYGPTIGIGPSIMLPIAASFKLFGIGIAQGRAVIVLYGIIALFLFFLLARKSYGLSMAALALTLLVSSRTFSQEGFIEYSRQVLGEVPGLTFMLAGLLSWQRTVEQPRLRESSMVWPCLTGLWFGLAMLTKNQFTLILVPAFGLVILADKIYFRAGNWKTQFLPAMVAMGCFGLLTILQYQFLGAGTFWQTVQETRRAASGAIFVFNPGSSLKSLIYLMRPDLYGGLLLPGLAYAIWKLRLRDVGSLRDVLLISIIGIWLLWFVSASLGWPRYAFPAVALGALTTARLLGAIWNMLTRKGSNYRYVVFAYIVLMISMPLYKTIMFVSHSDDSAQQFAQVINKEVPADASIATWEQELAVLTDHHYRYPPQSLLNDAVKHEWFGGPAPYYNWMENPTDYVAIGPFAQYTLIADDPSFKENYHLLTTVGPYELYQRIKGNA